MKIIKLTSSNHRQVINQAVKTLQANGLIIFPTETCYGAGVIATSQTAVNKLLSYKAKRQGKPLSIAVADKTMAETYVNLNPTAKNLYSKFLPGPLTVVSQSRRQVAAGVESETNSLGIRIPDYPLVISLIRQLKQPITATSANVSYKPRPYSIPQLLKYTSKKQQSLIDLIIDAGQLPPNPPSTVVDTTLDDPLILRQGKYIPLRRGMFQQVITKSPQQTSDLAKTLLLKHWNQLQTKPLIFLLIGDLGTGKTQFCKGIGQFLNINQPITSPTFTIEAEYIYSKQQTQGIFYHLDTWRMQSIQELNQLQLKSKLKPHHIIAVEWADRTIKPLVNLAKTTQAILITLKLQTVSSTFPSHRQITVSSSTPPPKP